MPVSIPLDGLVYRSRIGCIWVMGDSLLHPPTFALMVPSQRSFLRVAVLQSAAVLIAAEGLLATAKLSLFSPTLTVGTERVAIYFLSSPLRNK